jgi:hypothetical protein
MAKEKKTHKKICKQYNKIIIFVLAMFVILHGINYRSIKILS